LFTVAKELVDLQVFSVCLSGGEPRTRDEFKDLAEYLGGHGIAVSTITNGCDLTDESIELFAKTMALVQVSVESASEGVHDAIRGKNTFAKAISSIKRMKEAGVRQVRVSSVATRDSIGDFPALLELCLQLGVHDLRGMPVVPIGRALTANCPVPTPEQDQTLKEQVRRWTEDPSISGRISVEWGDPVQHIKIGLLYGFVLGANITADGYYRFSPYFNVAMGNFRRMCLKDAWMQGLGVAWKHPEIAAELEGVKSPTDFGRVFSDRINASKDGCLDLLCSSSTSPVQEAAYV
jgi:MoaA/NifB/PqqE/SkfB family radical SAM enzyme